MPDESSINETAKQQLNIYKQVVLELYEEDKSNLLETLNVAKLDNIYSFAAKSNVGNVVAYMKKSIENEGD